MQFEIEELEGLEAPGFWSFTAGVVVGFGVGVAIYGAGVLIT
jgi:hypothetical protein